MEKTFQKRKVKFKSKEREKIIFYAIMAAFPILQFVIFWIGVNFNSIILAFKEYNPLNNTYRFVWFKNIGEIFKDLSQEKVLQYSIINSLKYFLTSLLTSTPLALIFSYYIFKKYFGAGLFRVVLFLPQVLSSVVLVILYTYMVENGVKTLGESFGAEWQGLLENPNSRLGTIFFFNIWIGFGTSTLLYVGAMGNISDSILEAAKLEGAGFFREFFSIVFPLIFPTFTTFFVMSLTGIFTNQLNLMSFYGEYVDYSLYTVGFYLYFRTLRGTTAIYPHLAAMGITITLFVAPLVLVVRRLLEKFGPSEE